MRDGQTLVRLSDPKRKTTAASSLRQAKNRRHKILASIKGKYSNIQMDHVRYINILNMALQLSGQAFIFGGVFVVSKSLWELRDDFDLKATKPC